MRKNNHSLILGILSAISASSAVNGSRACAAEPTTVEELAQRVTIHRDEFGVPHIFGDDDESTFFGFGYAQAEDNFWQLEDVYILALGRYSELHGPQGLNSDLLNRTFEIVPRSRRDYPALDDASRRLYAAFVAGINHFLATHPNTRPRLIDKFEPWHVLAYHRHVALELTFRFTGLSDDYLPRRNPQVWAATGSNGWALAGSRTASGHPMLLANPHMPWFGFTQLFEVHLHSQRAGSSPTPAPPANSSSPTPALPESTPWNFIGAAFYGSPVPALGHNDRLGWTLVTNAPDIADLWRVRFTNPDNPLAYEYDGAWRSACQWTETIRVRKSQEIEERRLTFRKTHHGPVVVREDDQTMLAAQISGLFDVVPMRQSLAMMRARTLDEFRTALAPMQLLYSNLIYADCDGNVWYVYNGRIPRRNPDVDWSRPVDGGDPATQWLGMHELDELPQTLNPSAGFVQNCNTSPFRVTDGDNPRRERFPAYLMADADVQNRRALRSMEILRAMRGVTFDQWQQAAFDTEVHWARHELPRFAKELKRLEAESPQSAAEVRPYLEHLLAWDGRITAASTAASLCHAWYELLHGPNYPGEELRPAFKNNPPAQLKALVHAAQSLEALHGDWQVPYGDLYRAQRVDQVADVTDARFNDNLPSLPTLGGHGPMGVVFTQYYSPSVSIPLTVSQRRRYGVAGTSYLATWEFARQGVRGASLVPFGASGDPQSPHYLDQAKLLSEQRLKPERFTEQQVIKHAVRSYHPGQ